MSIFALHLNGQEFLTENFRQAMRTAAVILIPDEAERQEVKRLAWFSGLSEMRSQGSFNQYLRYLNGHQGGLSFRIDEHELGGPSRLAYSPQNL
jgi:hypothetical protein